MKNVTLRQFRYFEALVRHGHFGRAAEACAISQPALSVQIRELEAELGATLFERGARHVRLTGFGEAVAEHVGTILREVEALGDLARASQGGFAGRLRIGVIPTIAPYLLPSLIGGLSQTYAGIDIHVRESLTERLIGELLEGRLDTAVVALPVSEPALVEVPLFEEPFLLIRHDSERDHPVPEAEDLRTMRLLLLEEGHCFRDQALSFCGLKSPVSRDSLEGSSLSTLVQMVGAGIGVTLIPQMAVPVETRSAAVCVAPLRDPQPARQVGMVWRKGAALTPALEKIAEEVRLAGERLLARQSEGG